MVKKGKAEGDELAISGFYGGGYTAPVITPTRAMQYLKNVHTATQLENLQVQVFPGPPDVWVEDETGEQDEDKTKELKETFEKVRGYASMQISWYEVMGLGASVKSSGYTRSGGPLNITEIRNLPAFRFSQYPGIGDIQNELMPGIVVNDAGETEVYQTSSDGMTQTKITNYHIITEPTAPQPAGEAYILPIYPIIAAIDHANKAADQQVDRIAAPSIFAQLEEQNAQVAAWAKTFVKKWGKDTSFVIPRGVTFPDVKIRETRTAEDRLNMLVKWIENYFNPTTVLQKGNSMGASDQGAARIWANYIAGTQSWIEGAYEEFFQPLLTANGYDNLYVRIRLKRPELDRSSEIREQIKVGIEGKAITTEEIRDNLSELVLKDTDDALLTMLGEQYASAITPSPFGNVVPAEQLKKEETTEKRINRAHNKAEKRLLKLIGED